MDFVMEGNVPGCSQPVMEGLIRKHGGNVKPHLPKDRSGFKYILLCADTKDQTKRTAISVIKPMKEAYRKNFSIVTFAFIYDSVRLSRKLSIKRYSTVLPPAVLKVKRCLSLQQTYFKQNRNTTWLTLTKQLNRAKNIIKSPPKRPCKSCRKLFQTSLTRKLNHCTRPDCKHYHGSNGKFRIMRSSH